MPQYSGVWNLAQQSQALTRQQWVTDPLFRNTTLLLQADNAAGGAQNNTFLDSSSNAFAITRNGNTTQGTFSPFSATGWSNYFDGSSYLTLGNPSTNSALALGSGDFTIECWVNLSVTTTCLIIGSLANNSGNGSWWINVNGPGYLIAFGYNTTAAGSGIGISRGTGVLAPNVWHHLAVTRSGANIRLYVDGVQIGTTDTGIGTSTIFAVNQNVLVGRCVPDPAAAWFVTGYISNIRIDKGAALYTGTTYTVPSSSLSTSVSSGTVSLLTCKSNRFVDEAGNVTPTVGGGTPSVQAFSPFAPQYQYDPAVTGGSGYFDGTTDYLTTPTGQTALTLGTNNFTVEMWFYPRTQVQTAPALFSSTPLLAMTNGILLQGTSSNNKLDLWVNNTNLTASSTNNYMVLNQWNHVAVCRTGGNTYVFYINGVAVNNVATNTTSLTANSWLVGYWTVSGNEFTGYISGFRILNGTALYSGATITIPTAPPTAITNTSLLLNFTNAGIYDGTLKNNLETVGNAQVSTTVVKYGSGSMYFDGTGDNLVAASSPLWTFINGDFTVEFWCYASSFGGNQCFIEVYADDSNRWNISAVGNINFFSIVGGTGSQKISAISPSTNIWHHIALTKLGSTFTLYIDGVNSGTSTTTSYHTTLSRLSIGASLSGGGASYYTGYLDDLRITKGIARYTRNFTPPQVALPRE